MKFFVGVHQPSDAHQFDRCMVSVNRLAKRKSDFAVSEWIMDSGAFTQIAKHGKYTSEPEEYAEQINRWGRVGSFQAGVSQDVMCEPFVLARTGKTVREHQEITIERYERIRAVAKPYVMPVLQGYHPTEYVEHIHAYGSLLRFGAWVGVGSVCKRNASPAAIEDVLAAIHQARPDLRLHGFGLKLTALASDVVRTLLHSADSMAWSWHARINGRDGNDPAEAHRYVERVRKQPVQRSLIADLLGAA